MNLWKIIVALSLIVLGAACQSEVSLTLDENYSYLTVTMPEREVTNMIEGLLTGGNTPLLQTADADLTPGMISVTGTAYDAARNQTYNGSLRVNMWAADGQLYAMVSEFNFAGFVADQSALARFNTDLANGLAANHRESDSDVTQLTISDTEFSFTIRTPRRN